jgi:hypothetical protein
VLQAVRLKYSETSVHRFRRESEKETIDVGAIVEIGFAQGPWKLNDGSGKTNYMGTIDRGFTVYKTIILPVVLYGCETWSLLLRDD